MMTVHSSPEKFSVRFCQQTTVYKSVSAETVETISYL